MPPIWKITAPKSDDEYFARLTKTIFQSGLNWKTIDNKWPNFEKAFAKFSIPRVARFAEKQIAELMNDESIVRNEKKIRSTVYNAQ